MITALLVLSLLGALIAAMSTDPKAELAKRSAVAVSLVATLASGAMYFGYNTVQGGFQFVEKAAWLPSLGISYHVGLDGISLPFVFLTALLTLVSVLASWQQQDKSFFSLLLVMMGALIGVFSTLDLILYFVAWEIVLIPMFFIIGVWGYENRRYAAIKFLLYSLTGSVFMLVAILALAFQVSGSAGISLSFDYETLRAHAGVLATVPQFAAWTFWGFLVAYLIKLPVFPLHTWLPHAHTQAPTAGSILLAGVLLKMGGYSIIRFNLGLFPAQMHQFQGVLAFLAVVGIIYGAYVAMAQKDLKRLVAYSSVSHMGFVLLGIASLTSMGIHGAVYQMVAHGIITGLMFMMVGFLANRTHTREISAMRGMYDAMPVLGGLMWMAFLGGLGLPGLAGFIGEFTSLLGAVQSSGTVWFGYAALIGIMITAGFILWTIQRVLLGRSSSEGLRLPDLSAIEIAAAAPLAALAIILGLFPPALTPWIDSAVQPLLTAVKALASR